MKTCAKCMAENADDAKFCKLCSSSLQQGAGKTCPSGKHIMDSTWSECAYCKADAASGAERSGQAPLPPRPVASPGGPAARKPTVVEGGRSSDPPTPPKPLRPPTQREDAPLPPRPAPRPFSPAAAGPGASPASASPASPATPSRGRTVFSPAVTPGQPPGVTKGRKIVGVLVTYSWHPDGKVYEVREGRNLIGRDATCEICVPEDETLSAVNSHITYRSGFVVGDMVSMMGTDLNGTPIEEQFCKMPNNSIIRSGSTHFTFIAVSANSETRKTDE